MNRTILLLYVFLAPCLMANAQASKRPVHTQAPKAASRDKSSGELAFEANCSRCHTAPEQLSPRITGTVLRHMRIRASLSAADEKALLDYLAP